MKLSKFGDLEFVTKQYGLTLAQAIELASILSGFYKGLLSDLDADEFVDAPLLIELVFTKPAYFFGSMRAEHNNPELMIVKAASKRVARKGYNKATEIINHLDLMRKIQAEKQFPFNIILN